MAFSLPGMIRAERITVSFSSTREQAVVIHGDARERRHRLCLAAADQDHEFVRIERSQVLRTYDHAIGNPQAFQLVRDFDVVHHAAADETNLAADARRDVNHLLDAMDRGCEARNEHFARRRAEELFDARPDGAFRRRISGALDIRAVAEEREHAFLPISREGVQIELVLVRRRLVNLEIAGVDNHADRRAHRKRDAINRAVRDGHEFDAERADLDVWRGATWLSLAVSSSPCSSRLRRTSASVKRVP